MNVCIYGYRVRVRAVEIPHTLLCSLLARVMLKRFRELLCNLYVYPYLF